MMSANEKMFRTADESLLRGGATGIAVYIKAECHHGFSCQKHFYSCVFKNTVTHSCTTCGGFAQEIDDKLTHIRFAKKCISCRLGAQNCICCNRALVSCKHFGTGGGGHIHSEEHIINDHIFRFFFVHCAPPVILSHEARTSILRR